MQNIPTLIQAIPKADLGLSSGKKTRLGLKRREMVMLTVGLIGGAAVVLLGHRLPYVRCNKWDYKASKVPYPHTYRETGMRSLFSL